MPFPHRRRLDCAAGIRLTPSGFDDSEYKTWAETIKIPHNSFGRSGGKERRYGPWTARKIPPTDYRSAAAGDGESSGGESPPLWKSESAGLSPSSRSQAQMIADYRKEMMDLVRNLPESGLELSLRDLVELSPAKQLRETMEERGEEGAALLQGAIDKKWIDVRNRSGKGGRARSAKAASPSDDRVRLNSDFDAYGNGAGGGRGRKTWIKSVWCVFLCRHGSNASSEL